MLELEEGTCIRNEKVVVQLGKKFLSFMEPEKSL
jgi:hypothetical protein